MNKWITCDELLPEGSGNVLVTDGEDVFIGWRLDGKWCSDSHDYYEFSHPIIAWMPLPEPYKIESEG